LRPIRLTIITAAQSFRLSFFFVARRFGQALDFPPRGNLYSNRLVLDWFIWRCQIKTVGSYEAKTHLPQLLERVARGEKITITKHGVPVATLQPVGSATKTTVEATIDQLKRFREGRRLDGLSIREMMEEGRR
jgi:prevent-host-death family protein